MSRKLLATISIISFLAVCGWVSIAQPQQRETPPPQDPVREKLQNLEQSLRFAEDSLTRQFDAQAIFDRLGDIAVVDKLKYTGPPPRVVKNPTGQGAANPVVISAYTFIPKNVPQGSRIPLMIYVHGGVHGHLETGAIHTLRELIHQGYAIVAPEYRGSSGYGKDFWELIDYGGLEVEDVFNSKKLMHENFDVIDPQRTGMMGWSHGGMITLLNLFNHPKDFLAGYVSVPVSDVVARMGYKGPAYREMFSAPYHIGKTAEENVNEYRRRSPAWNAEKLENPLPVSKVGSKPNWARDADRTLPMSCRC